MELMAYAAAVKKEKVRTRIRTSKESVEGFIFKLPQTRLLDMINNDSEPFFAVSDAEVCSVSDGKLLYKTGFLAVNKKHVVHVSGEVREEDQEAIEEVQEGDENESGDALMGDEDENWLFE